ncbi:hypothetical protein Ddye_016477 [Dipteronia dyeriana]|uniref:Uncharacterized protein n=1 Tax=Dipteronia dyeriana TaxID=168575 RepID=A0AAD9U7H4_9ROSI|nr:hypothetical protein Ddye_016477 [Dipteronia dyeriana]
MRKREGGDSPVMQLINDNDFAGPVIVNKKNLDHASVSLGTSQEPVCGQARSDESLDVIFSQTSNIPDSLQRPVMVPTVVHVSRPDEVENNRRDLPIVMMEQKIMEVVNYNNAIIMWRN